MNSIQSWAFGLVVGAIVATVCMTFAVNSTGIFEYLKEQESKITECQKDLPRSQKCVLIAIPEKQENK